MNIKYLIPLMFLIMLAMPSYAYDIRVNFYDENSFSAIPTVTITDANGSVYTSDANGLWVASLTGAKSFEISKTGYDTRPFELYFKADANYNFLLSPTGTSSDIEFLVKDTNDSAWSNKYLMFNRTGLYLENKPLDRSFETITNWTYSESDITSGYITGTQSSDWATDKIYSYRLYIKGNINKTNYGQILQSVDFTNVDFISFDYKLVCTYNVGPTYTSAYANIGATNIFTKAFVRNTTETGTILYDVSAITGNQDLVFRIQPTQDNASINTYFYIDNIKLYLKSPTDIFTINSLLTSSQGYATATILPAGDYNALLYNATGDLNYTYAKTTVTVNKPKNEKTSALISPYDIYVSGLLQYSLTNQTASSVTFNVFAGTTDFYTFTAVDYNTVVADQKYIPKSYFVQVPMGNSYVNAITYQPYLLLKTDGIVPKVVVLDQLNRTIENAQIYVSKYVGGILTVVESGNTFSNGAFNFSAYPLDVYYLTVYYNGTDYGTFSVQPRESSDIFYIKIDRTTAEDIAQALIIQTNLDDTSRYQNRDTNINVLGTITSNFNYITDYNVNVYERGNLVYSSNTVATGQSIDINKFVDVNLIPDYVHSAVIKVIVNYSIAGVTGSQTFSKNIMITDSPDVIGTIEDAQTEIGQPLSIFIALAVAIMLMAVLIFSGILTDPAILAVFGALVIGVFMMLGFLDIGVVVLGMDIGRFAYFLGLMATLYFALFGGR